MKTSENMSGGERCGIPVAVRLRAYRSHALVAAVALMTFILLLEFILGEAVFSVCNIRRVNLSPQNELVISAEPNGDECFYYLKNYAVSGSTEQNALSDILMLRPSVGYKENTIGFSGTLSPGECAVSANIANKYGLGIGDRATVMGSGKSFSVSALIPAQEGLDEDYRHEGIVILAYDEELLDRSYLYISFMTDGDGYKSLQRLVYLEDWRDADSSALVTMALVAAVSVPALMLLCEIFIFRRRRYDYRTLALLGERGIWLTVRVLCEDWLKYLLPAALAVLLYLPVYSPYKLSYFIPALSFTVMVAAASAVYSFLAVRRLYHVRKK